MDRSHIPAKPSRAGRTAVVCGVGGQDGSYLAAHLLALGYTVIGTSRDVRSGRFAGLERLGIRDHVVLESMVLGDFHSVLGVLSRTEPDEVYNLAGQTSVGLSFDQPLETLESIVFGTAHLLEAVRTLGRPIRLFNAGSAEMFGDTGAAPANESTPLNPRSPYGIAKATAFWQVDQYRRTYGVAACTGILFNHESPLRPERFVTQKIVAAACRVAAGTQDALRLGDLSVRRDWGWAPEYVVAMHRMLEQGGLTDCVIATGQTSSLEDFVREVFAAMGLDWRRYVVRDPALERPGEIPCSCADPSRAADRLGWRPRWRMPDVARMMVEARLGPRPESRRQAA